MKKISFVLLLVLLSSVAVGQLIERITDIHPTGGSDPSHFFVWNNTLFFYATNFQYGKELWATDGTAAGTYLVQDWTVSGDSWPKTYLPLGNKLLISQSFGPADSRARNLIATTGVQNSMYEVGAFSLIDTVVSMNGFAYVLGCNPGCGLWKTDGANIGTTLVRNFSDFTEMVEFNGRLFISAADTGSTDLELWISDGTTTGTKLLKNINTSKSSDPKSFIALNNKLYFIATDSATGRELWVTDGTDTGTHIFMDLNPGKSSAMLTSYGLFSHNSKLYFFAKPVTPVDSPQYLYVSNGTSIGTRRVMPFMFMKYITAFNGKMYFQGKATTTDQEELWVCDDTDTGTILLKDCNIGGAGVPNNLFVFDNRIYFNAIDYVYGGQLWVSDGTTSGTYMPPLFSTLPWWGVWNTQFIEYKGGLYFGAYYDSYGRELWRYSPTTGMVHSPVQESSLSVYPNPAKNFIRIKTRTPTVVTIYDVFGKKVLSIEVLGNANVDVSHFTPGYYVIRSSLTSEFVYLIKE